MSGKHGTSSDNGPVLTSVIGLGRSGWNIHIKAIRDREDFRITDVADPVEERRKQAEDELGADSYEDPEELFKNSDAELAIIATKSVDHYRHTINAFQAGMNVLVEKPMAMSYDEARRMENMADKEGLKLFVHQNQRFRQDTQFFKSVCTGNMKIGNVFAIHGQAFGFSRRNDWQTLKKYGGGLLNNHLTHIVDKMLYILDDTVENILCDMQHTTDSGDCEDHVSMLLKMKEGTAVNLTVSTSCNADAPQWIFMGEFGTLSVWKDRAEIRYFDPEKHEKLEVQDLEAAAERSYGNEEELEWITEEIDVWQGNNIGTYHDNVYEVLKKDGEMVVSPESVVELTRVLEICREQNRDFIL